jgi:hypothetical protein
MNEYRLQTMVCVASSLILLGMAIVSASVMGTATYEVATGLLCSVFCLVPIFIRKAGLITIPVALIICAEVAIFLHAYGVLLMKYDFIHVWDTVTHTISSSVVAIFVFYGLLCIERFDGRMNSSPRMIHIYILLITMTFSVIWEVFEILADQIWSIHMQYSPFDTIRDFTCDFAGAMIVVAFSFFKLRKHSVIELVDKMQLHPKIIKYIGKHEHDSE